MKIIAIRLRWLHFPLLLRIGRSLNLGSIVEVHGFQEKHSQKMKVAEIRIVFLLVQRAVHLAFVLVLFSLNISCAR